MTLFTYILGLDLEMAFKHHYHEVLDTIGDMFTQIFRGLRDRYQVGSSVFTKTVLQIRDVYPGSRIRIFSIPDPVSEFFPSRIRIKEFKYFIFNPKKFF
jgi:hypothetical protein